MGEEGLTFLSLEMAPRCNARCLYCFSAHELGLRPRDALSLAEYKRVIHEAVALGLRTVVYPGVGEPLLDAKTLSLIEFCAGLGIATVVYTCGVIDEKVLPRLRACGTSMIIKMDSLCPQHYERLVGLPFGPFANSLSLILAAYRGSSEHVGSFHITRLAANTVVTRVNKNDITPVAQLCRKNGIIHFVETLSRAGAAADHWDKLVGKEYAELREIAESYGHWVSSATIDGRCGLYAHGITIDVNGDLLACPTARWIRLGNICDHSIAELIAIRNDAFPNIAEHYCAARELTVGPEA